MIRGSMRRVLGPSTVLVVVAAVVVVGPFLAPYSPTATNALPFQSPSPEYWLGTDFVGRDVMSRVLHGGHRLVIMAAVALTVSYCLGLLLGVIAGMSRRLDGWVMRPVDVVVVLPWFLLLVVVATAVGQGPVSVSLAVGLAIVPWVAKVVRTATIELMDSGYVEAAIGRGESRFWIAARQIVPNLRAVLLADAGIRVSAAISMVTAGSFLGLGVSQPQPDWALMITENKGGMSLAPLAVLVPATLIAALVISLNLCADRLGRVDIPAPGHRLAHTQSSVRRSLVDTGEDLGMEPEGLAVRGLSVVGPDGDRILNDVNLTVSVGNSIAVTGPSGAGKTTLALSLVEALPRGFEASGSAHMGKAGHRIGYVPQDPALSLNPALRVGTALREVMRARGGIQHSRLISILSGLALPHDRKFLRRYPNQLSGGQQQRILIAMALLGRPTTLVLDEPTSGLDVASAEELVSFLARLRTDYALVIITHDLASVAAVVDSVVTVDRGTVRATKPPRGVLLGVEQVAVRRPDRLRSPAIPESTPVRVLIDGLDAGYGRVPVLRGFSLTISERECVAVTGRSGAGKSTLARCLVGLHEPTAGSVWLDGKQLAPTALQRSVPQRRAMGMVFQNPRRSLDPRRTVGDELERVLRVLRGLQGGAAAVAGAALLDSVHLERKLWTRRPGELSGGQAQRVAIARALAGQPAVLICDEVTASLDAVVGDAVLSVIDEIRCRGTSVLMISHDLATIDRMATRAVTLELPDPGPRCQISGQRKRSLSVVRGPASALTNR